MVNKLSEIWVGSEIQDPKKLIPDPDPRIKNAPDPGFGSATQGISMHTVMTCTKKQARSFLIA
jgi:hypothetical protein